MHCHISLQNKGTVAGISSIAGYRGLPGRSGYSASKFALQGWMEALRTEMLESGVNVMWVCPGFTKSNIRNAALNKDSEPQGETPLDENSLMSARRMCRTYFKSHRKKKTYIGFNCTRKRNNFIKPFYARARR